MMLRTKGGDASDALTTPEGAEGLMLDVATLKDDGTALSRPADFHDLARAGAECGFAAGHGGAVAQHGDADERVGVGMPVDDRLFVVEGRDIDLGG